MTKNEKYQPLEQSELWRDMTASTEEYFSIYPTKLHQFENLAFGNGTGYEWSQGKLIDIYEAPENAPIRFDQKFEAPEACLKEDPENNPLFSLVPEVSPREFIKDLSTDPSILRMADRVKTDQPVYPICQFASICDMPHNADVHYLSALLTMCKHVLQHPERLEEGSRGEQLNFVSDALNTGFEIISQRSIENNFAKSCAELQDKIPFLTAFQPKYVEEQDKQWKEEFDFKRMISAYSPLQNREIKREIEELLRKLAPPKTGPAAP